MRASSARRRGLGRVLVHLHEHRVDAEGHRGAGQRLDVLALSSRAGALPARQLHRVGRVEDHGHAEARITGDRGSRRPACCSRRSPRARSGARPCTRRRSFSTTLLHVPGREELALLDVHGAAAPGAARTRSVWRQRNAGIWTRSRTSAAAGTSSGSWTSERTGHPKSRARGAGSGALRAGRDPGRTARTTGSPCRRRTCRRRARPRPRRRSRGSRPCGARGSRPGSRTAPRGARAGSRRRSARGPTGTTRVAVRLIRAPVNGRRSSGRARSFGCHRACCGWLPGRPRRSSPGARRTRAGRPARRARRASRRLPGRRATARRRARARRPRGCGPASGRRRRRSRARFRGSRPAGRAGGSPRHSLVTASMPSPRPAAREHEEHLVPVAGGGEAPRLVAGVLVGAGRDLPLVGHEHLHVRPGRAVVLVGALPDGLAERQGTRDVVVRHVGGPVADPVDAVPLLVDLTERLPVAQRRDPVPERSRPLGERLHQDAVHAPRDASGLAGLEHRGHVVRDRVGGLAQLVRVIVAARESGLQRVEEPGDAEPGHPRLEHLAPAVGRHAPVLGEEALAEGGIGSGGGPPAPPALLEHGRGGRRRRRLRQGSRPRHEGDRGEEAGDRPHWLPWRRAAPTKPAKSGCGAQGRDRNSGWNWPATNQGWSGSSTISTSCFSGHTPETRNPFFSRSFRYSLETS